MPESNTLSHAVESSPRAVVEAVVTKIEWNRPHRDTIDPTTGYVATRECSQAVILSCSATEATTGKIIENLPCAGLNFKHGNRIRITVEVIK